jgi:glycolate oxidase
VALEPALLEIERALPSGSVIVDRDLCASYAGDESDVAPHLPDAVVRARSAADVAAVLRAASSHQVFVTPRAAGTGKSGGAIPVRGGIVLALDAFAGIEEIHAGDLVAVSRPGTRTGVLRDAVLAEGLFYAPDPNSLGECTLGGNVAENAGGPSTFRYGSTRDWTLGLEIVTADGTILEIGKRTHKGVTGYDLVALLCGSEGTLGVITRITSKLAPAPERVRTLAIYLGALRDVGPATMAVQATGLARAIELLDDLTLAPLRERGRVQLPVGAQALLLVDLDGEEPAIERATERLAAKLEPLRPIEILVADTAAERERLWSVRREMSRTLRSLVRHKLSEDVVVPRSRLGALLEACRTIAAGHRVHMPSYGHAGDGNLHVNFLWDDPADAPRVKLAGRAVFEEVVRLGGTLTGEHGIGASKIEHLSLEQSAEVIGLQERLKATFDPKGVLNPGKMFPARHAC